MRSDDVRFAFLEGLAAEYKVGWRGERREAG